MHKNYAYTNTHTIKNKKNYATKLWLIDLKLCYKKYLTSFLIQNLITEKMQ